MPNYDDFNLDISSTGDNSTNSSAPTLGKICEGISSIVVSELVESIESVVTSCANDCSDGCSETCVNCPSVSGCHSYCGTGARTC